MVTNPFTKQTILLNSKKPYIGAIDRRANRWSQVAKIARKLEGTPKEAKAKALLAKARSRSLEDAGIYVLPKGDGGPVDIYKPGPKPAPGPYKSKITEIPKTKFRKRKKSG